MLYIEIIAVCSQIHTKLINTLWWQNVHFFCSKGCVQNTLHSTLYTLHSTRYTLHVAGMD